MGFLWLNYGNERRGYVNMNVSAMKSLPSGAIALSKGISINEKLTLRYACHPKLYAIPRDAERSNGIDEKNGLRIVETHNPEPRAGLSAHLGKYVITIEASISTSDALWEVGSTISKLADDLDRFWIYACGEPLNPVVYTIAFDSTPCGWESNVQEVTEKLARASKQAFAVVQQGPHQHWIDMPCYPLRLALNAWHAYNNVADEETKALADIHYDALKSTGGYAKAHYLSNALELAERLMPGKTRADKMNSLPPEIKAELGLSLHDLFDIANNRFNVRHVVQKKSVTKLHPRMTGNEVVAFGHDADVIVRAVVCQKLGIQTPRLHKSTSS